MLYSDTLCICLDWSRPWGCLAVRTSDGLCGIHQSWARDKLRVWRETGFTAKCFWSCLCVYGQVWRWAINRTLWMVKFFSKETPLLKFVPINFCSRFLRSAKLNNHYRKLLCLFIIEVVGFSTCKCIRLLYIDVYSVNRKLKQSLRIW